MTVAVYTSSTTGVWRSYTNETSVRVPTAPSATSGPLIRVYTNGTSSSITASTSTSNTFIVTANGTHYYNDSLRIATTGITQYIQYSVPQYSDEQRRRFEKQNRILLQTRESKARAAIKRALKLYDNVGMGKDVRVFLGGSTVEVSHPDSLFKFVIDKGRHRLIDKTVSPGYSTPYNLSLYTKSDIHVADLCVYMKDTPVLDQVLALSMFIKSGSEDLILKQANWRFLTKDIEAREILALEYPYLEDKLKVNDVARLNGVAYFNGGGERLIAA